MESSIGGRSRSQTQGHREPRWLFRDISVSRDATVCIPLCWAPTIPTRLPNAPGISLRVPIRAFDMAGLAITESPLQSLRKSHVARTGAAGWCAPQWKLKSFISKEAYCILIEHTESMGKQFSILERFSFDLCLKT